jgi:hypothetical protein
MKLTAGLQIDLQGVSQRVTPMLQRIVSLGHNSGLVAAKMAT